MITSHVQKQMLEVYRLICGKEYDFKKPMERNSEPHRRMQASCCLASLLFLFPDFGFSLEECGPYSAGVELALRLMERSGNVLKSDDSNRSIPPLTIVDIHERILNPLYKSMNVDEEHLTRYLELAAGLCHTAKVILPSADTGMIVHRVIDGKGFTFSAQQAAELLTRFQLAGLIT